MTEEKQSSEVVAVVVMAILASVVLLARSGQSATLGGVAFGALSFFFIGIIAAQVGKTSGKRIVSAAVGMGILLLVLISRLA